MQLITAGGLTRLYFNSFLIADSTYVVPRFSIINSTVRNVLVAVFSQTFVVIFPGQFSGNGISAELWTSSLTFLQREEEEDLG